MIKKILCLLLTILLVFSLTSCKKKDMEYDQHYYEPSTEEPTKPESTVKPAPTDVPQEPEEPEKEDENPYSESLEAEFPSSRVECEYQDMLKMAALADLFNSDPEEFTSSAQLSNASKFFAAVAYKQDDFTMSEDGFMLSLPISELEAAVRTYFGSNASLSSGWTTEDYSPYLVDEENGLVVSFGMGTPSTFLYPWAAIDKGDGVYELWMLNLLDPLYSDEPENALLIESGNPSAVPMDAIEDIARDVQTNVYTFQQSGSSYYLIGFEYKNYKGISNYLVLG
ncbi:MAG: hypothetical protein IJI78_06015 [Oscillospiraceae bacterium]|nr:hypothetical protein [Oscillospiraceae bacterium]